ncbi:hypothetical protein BDK51DRAFT_43063 [Blyttiomyces helicus]|uniref:Uncharacterized protein n=1 Tax=Blyttiomyces helicus TaxID=388810 RepID=A0A4P9W384_9FUNG|nr:hypothetical protein BDK51DRAFT_43063 [Blyttiomyces helicus]|eukprot:RKO85805.1 hypothetical protein BDK51DRAFT_43063 [Blyttiomyces helicus]
MNSPSTLGTQTDAHARMLLGPDESSLQSKLAHANIKWPAAFRRGVRACIWFIRRQVRINAAVVASSQKAASREMVARARSGMVVFVEMARFGTGRVSAKELSVFSTLETRKNNPTPLGSQTKNPKPTPIFAYSTSIPDFGSKGTKRPAFFRRSVHPHLAFIQRKVRTTAALVPSSQKAASPGMVARFGNGGGRRDSELQNGPRPARECARGMTPADGTFPTGPTFRRPCKSGGNPTPDLLTLVRSHVRQYTSHEAHFPPAPLSSHLQKPTFRVVRNDPAPHPNVTPSVRLPPPPQRSRVAAACVGRIMHSRPSDPLHPIGRSGDGGGSVCVRLLC